MFEGSREIRALVWLVHELIGRVNYLEETVSQNSGAIAADVAELQAAATAITAKIDALQTAVDNGEDLSGPLAELKSAADAVAAIAPAAPVTPAAPDAPTS